MPQYKTYSGGFASATASGGQRSIIKGGRECSNTGKLKKKKNSLNISGGPLTATTTKEEIKRPKKKKKDL